MSHDKVYLVGFMAAGKTTLGAALAARLGWRLLDLDQLIEQRERQSVASLFASRGEPYFRAVEHDVLCACVPARFAIVATGGGTFVPAENRAIINSDGLSIWLDLPLTDLIERLPTDGRRPLANDRQQLGMLYEARRLAYQQAHVRLDCAARPVPALVEQVLDHLGL